METRIIRTKIYRDKVFRKLTDREKFVTIFLLTNEFLEALPIIEVDLEILAFHSSVTESFLSKLIKEKLSYFQIFYINGYLIVGDLFAYANYKGGKTKSKKERLYEALPEEIKKYIDTEGNIAQSLLNHCPIIEHINHKSKTINHKLETINQKPKIEDERKMELNEILERYNQIFGKDISSTKGFETNYDYWKEIHSMEKIQKALENASKDKFWKDKMTLTILFRRKNPNGEPVDYIEDLASREPNSRGDVAII